MLWYFYIGVKYENKEVSLPYKCYPNIYRGKVIMTDLWFVSNKLLHALTYYTLIKSTIGI